MKHFHPHILLTPFQGFQAYHCHGKYLSSKLRPGRFVYQKAVGHFALDGMQEFAPLLTTGISISALVAASCTLVNDSVYLFGGFHLYTDEVYNNLFRLNLSNPSWTQVITISGEWPCKRNDHSACLWDSDKIIIHGGSDESANLLNDVYILNLTTSTWTKINTRSNSVLQPRARHNAIVYNSKMYVTGGSLSTMSILDLKSMEWEDSVDFVERQLHYSFVYKNRLYIWGGIMESGDKVVDLCFIDLADYDVTTLKIESNDSPPIFGQHYAQLFGNKMCLIICDQMTSADTPVGIWSLDLDLMVWKKVDDGEFLKLGHWHYLAVSGCIGSNEVFRDEDEIMENSFTEQQQQHASSSNTWTLRRTISSNSLKNATAPNSSSKSASKARIVLFGAEDNSSDDYVSRLLLLDMEQFGFYDIPGINTHEDDILSSAKAIPQSLMYDISTMLTNLGDFTDFELVSSIDANPVPIRVHKTILLARWPHFSALIRSGMTESQIGSLPLPEKTRTLQEFVNYIYTDSVSNAPTEVVSDLLILANLYCLERLQKMCAVRLYTQELTVENSAQAFERAVKVHDEGLIKMSVRFITENFGAVSRTPEFRSLNGEILRVFWDSMPPSATITTTKRTRNSRD